MKRRTRQSGFTMVEVMVTVSIIGILAAISIPTVINVMPKVRLSGATQTLANEVAMARMSAIAKSSDFGVKISNIDTGSGEYTLGRFDSSNTFIPFATSKIGSSAKIASVRFKSDYAEVPYVGTAPTQYYLIKLYANGTTSVPMSKEAVYIQLQTADDTVKRRVVVHTTGRISSEKWRGGADSDPGNWKAE